MATFLFQNSSNSVSSLTMESVFRLLTWPISSSKPGQNLLQVTEFYRNFQQNPDKAAALRSAMLTTMKQHHNPRDWAAFTLIGESQ